MMKGGGSRWVTVLVSRESWPRSRKSAGRKKSSVHENAVLRQNKLSSFAFHSSVMFVLTRVQVSRGSMLWLLKRQIFGRRHAVTAPDTSAQMRCVVQEPCIIGGMRPLSTHGAAAGRAATQKEIKRISLRPSHPGAQSFLRSNRLTHFLWLWCPLCLSSWTATAKAGGKKIKIWRCGRCSTRRWFTSSPRAEALLKVLEWEQWIPLKLMNEHQQIVDFPLRVYPPECLPALTSTWKTARAGTLAVC